MANRQPRYRPPGPFDRILADAGRYPVDPSPAKRKPRPHYTKLPETRQRRADKLTRLAHARKYR